MSQNVWNANLFELVVFSGIREPYLLLRASPISKGFPRELPCINDVDPGAEIHGAKPLARFNKLK